MSGWKRWVVSAGWWRPRSPGCHRHQRVPSDRRGSPVLPGTQLRAHPRGAAGAPWQNLPPSGTWAGEKVCKGVKGPLARSRHAQKATLTAGIPALFPAGISSPAKWGAGVPPAPPLQIQHPQATGPHPCPPSPGSREGTANPQIPRRAPAVVAPLWLCHPV